MRNFFMVVIASAVFALASLPAMAATGLKIQPLEYTAQLAPGERERGVVDISNPSDTSLRVRVSVQAAKQVDNDGALEFYDDEAIAAGVLLDHDEITLPARGAYRLVFELDGSKLPAGDSVAALFAQTTGDKGSLRGQARVGTLLFITNGTPSGRDAAITALHTQWLQTNREVTGRYEIANTADATAATGYRPAVTIQLAPFHEAVKTQGPLVFAGHKRSGQFSLPTAAFGVYKLTISTENSQQSRWVLLIPAWSALLLVGLFVAALGWRYARRRRIHPRGFRRPKKP